MKKYTVGVIGAGRMGKIHIKNILRNIPDLKLKVVADISIDDQMKAWAQEMGVKKLINDASEIFNDPDIEVVVIASSTETHIEFIREAAKAKKRRFL